MSRPWDRMAILILSSFLVQYTEGFDRNWVNPMDMAYPEETFPSHGLISSGNKDDSHCNEYIRPFLLELEQCKSGGKRTNAVDSVEGIRREEASCKMHMTRFINVILRSIQLQDRVVRPDEHKSVKIEVKITGEQLKILKNFGDGSEKSLHKLDEVLSNMFLHTVNEKYARDAFSKFQDLASSVHLSPEFLIVTFTGGLIVSFMWLVLSGRSYRTALIIFLMLIFMLAFGWNWYKFYKEEMVKKNVILMKHKELPVDCRPWDKAWYQTWYTFFFQNKDKCEEYFIALQIEPHINVSPDRVFVETFSALFLFPLKHMGSIMMENIKGLTDHLPFPFGFILKTFLTIVSFVFIMFLLLLVLTFAFGRDFIFKLPFISLSLTKSGMDMKDISHIIGAMLHKSPVPSIEQNEDPTVSGAANHSSSLRQSEIPAVTEAKVKKTEKPKKSPKERAKNHPAEKPVPFGNERPPFRRQKTM